MSTTPINAAPMTLLLGIQDTSATALSVVAETLPSHLAKVYLYTQKGPTTPQLVAGDGLVQMYGAASFDESQKWATHATVLSNILSAAANPQMIERLVPVDAGPKANFCLYLDVLSTTVPQYQRASDGSYILDGTTGLPLLISPATSVPGYICKWVVETVTTGLATSADSTLFGNLTSKTGDQTDSSGTHSTRYPILQFWANSFGDYANNAGFRIWAPTADDATPVNSSVMSKLKVYPFRMCAISRASATSTATINSMISGDTSFEFTFKPSQVNPNTTAKFSLGDVLPGAYQSLNKAGYDNVYADLSGLHIYNNYISTLTTQFYNAEKSIGGAGSDFSTSATDQAWMFNFISGVSSSNIPYHSFRLQTTDANAVALTESTNLWAAGGSDGTMNETLFAGLVTTAVSEYADPLSSLNDTAINVESIIYDSGFPLATKLALTNFISQRKDTFVWLSTYDVNGQELSESDEAALGAALRTQLQLFPESTFYGTSTARGGVMARYGTLLGHAYTKKLPVTLELASKAAKMMGAASGSWNKTYLFDKAPNSELTMFADLNVTFVPGSQRNTDWSNGLNYPLSFSRSTNFFPAIKTVYPDDTSVLTSFITAMACCQLQKVGEQAWRNFSGSISLTESQLKKSVTGFITDATQGKFAGLFTITPNVVITASDEQRGYSWTTQITIGANSMRTVQVLSVIAERQTSTTSA